MTRESINFLELIWELTPCIRHTYDLCVNAAWQFMPCDRRRGNYTGWSTSLSNTFDINNICQTVFVTTSSKNKWHLEIVTVEFPVNLGIDLLWGNLTILCLWLATEVFQLKIHRAEVHSCFVSVRIYSYVCRSVICG
jgi:hypothetical protein